MKIYQQEIINSVAAYEAESGRELPANSFYKSLALQFARQTPTPNPRPPAPDCTFCDAPAAALPTADWPMCESCFEAVAAPFPEETCDPLF